MYIKSLNIQNTSNGLNDIKMNRLGKVVLIAGKKMDLEKN